jgi:ACS family hexuronate transporter-like MFS transporter
MQSSSLGSRRWKVLTVLWVTQTVSSFVLLVIPPIAPFLQRDLNLTHTQIGLFISATYIGIASLSIASGNLTDSLGVRRMLTAGIILMGIILIFTSQLNAFLEIAILLFFLGIAYSSIPPSTSKGVIEWFPRNERGIAMGIKQTGFTIGGLIAAGILPILASVTDWRFSFILSGIMAILIGVPVLSMYREFHINEVQQSFTRWKSQRKILSSRNVWMISLIAMVYGAVQLSFTTYAVLYLNEVMGLGVVLAGLYLASANGSGAFARIVFGLISDHLFKGRRKVTFVLNGCITSVMCIVLGMMNGATYTWVVFIIIVIFGFSAMGYNAIMLTFVGESVHRELSGAAVGLTLTLWSIGGIIGPPLFGYAVDLTETYTFAWYALGICIALAAIMLTVFVKETKLIDLKDKYSSQK